MSKQEPTKKKGFSRRKFLVRSSVGLGVILGAGYLSRGLVRRYLAELANTVEAPYSGDTSDPTLWFEITADNRIVLHCPKVEMGQGSFTGLAQIAADELEVNMDQLNIVHAATDTRNVDSFATGGSTSISSLWQPLREMAATMREMIKAEAATIMGTDVASLSVNAGVVSSGTESLTYGEVVQKVKEWKVPDVPPLKELKDYKFIGKPIQRVDLKDKVMGTPMFGMDATMPDMLYGAVVRPSAIGATYVDADVSKAEEMPGVVKVVKEKDFVGVVAKSMMEAEYAKNAIEATWDIPRQWQTADIENAVKVGSGTPYVIQKKGKAKQILEDQEELITAEYKSPIGAHAQLEPNGAVAHVEGKKVTIMMSTQVPDITRKEVADRLGLDKEQVNIQPTYLGGGFGRRLHTPNAIQAAILSKAVGKPVKCFYDRKEEFQMIHLGHLLIIYLRPSLLEREP